MFDNVKWGTLIAILLLHVFSLPVLLPRNFSWLNLVVFAFFCVYTILGITFGYHRMETHKAFEAHPTVRTIALIGGSLAIQGPVTAWVSGHKRHHQYSDQDSDMHNSNLGFWWSHMGWLFKKFDLLDLEKRVIANLKKDKLLAFLSNDYIYILMQVVLGLIFLAIGGWSMVCWGLFARVVVVYHITWLVNSATHMWGYRTFQTDDNSCNNWLVAALAFGEGWHNNHHAHQSSPRHGLRLHEIDFTWYLIWILSKLDLVSDLKEIPNIP